MPISNDPPFHPPEENEEESISRMFPEAQGHVRSTTQHCTLLWASLEPIFSILHTVDPLSVLFRPIQSVYFLMHSEASNAGNHLLT